MSHDAAHENRMHGEPEEPHEVGVGAEAAVADADPVLGAEPRRDERVGDALDGEGHERQACCVRAEEPHAVDRCQPGPEVAGDLGVVVGDGVPAELAEGVDGGVQRHRADDVRRAGFLALGWVGPGHFVEVDQVDGATTVRFTHSGLWDEEAVRSHERGWGRILDNLGRMLQAQSGNER